MIRLTYFSIIGIVIALCAYWITSNPGQVLIILARMGNSPFCRRLNNLNRSIYFYVFNGFKAVKMAEYSKLLIKP